MAPKGTQLYEYTCLCTSFFKPTDERGGGVSVYVSHKIRCEMLYEFTDGTSEYEVLSLKTDYDLVIYVVYRPPSATLSGF